MCWSPHPPPPTHTHAYAHTHTHTHSATFSGLVQHVSICPPPPHSHTILYPPLGTIAYIQIHVSWWVFFFLLHIVTPFSTRPHQNAFWYNNSSLGFLKILNDVLKEREKISAINEPSFFTVLKRLQWLIGIILGKIICESSNWQHNYTKIEDHYSWCKLATV